MPLLSFDVLLLLNLMVSRFVDYCDGFAYFETQFLASGFDSHDYDILDWRIDQIYVEDN